MIEISSEEAKIIRKKLPSTVISTTCKQRSSRGKNWCEANSSVLKLLTRLREEPVER